MLDLQKKLDALTLLLLGGIVFWVALYAFIGPQVLGGDGFHFKDAGINFSIGIGFKEVATHANPSLEYKYYANYPPVYPFLYGLYAFVFGVGDYQNTFFNLLLHVAKSILLFIIVVQHSKDWTSIQKIIITSSIILFLPASSSYDRPEDLVVVLFLTSVLFYLRQQYKIAFLVAGLNLMTSPVCGFISAVILLGIYFHDVFREKVEWKALIEKSYPVLYMLVFPVIIIAILALLDLSIFERFYSFMTYLSVKGSVKGFDYIKSAQSIGLFYGIVPLFSFIFIIFLGLIVLFFAYQASAKRLALFMTAVTSIVAFLNLQRLTNYYQFFTVFGLTIGMYMMMREVEKMSEIRKKVLLICLVIILLMTLPRVVRDIYIRVVPMNAEKYRDARERLQGFFKDKPDEFILTHPQFYFMTKSVKPSVAAMDLFSSDEPNIPRYIVEPSIRKDSVITFLPNPKIFTPKVEKTYLYRKVFETETSVPNPQNTFWERLLMRPHETWYPVIYERIDEQ